MNNDEGELTKKAEILEINFLQEMGVDTLGKYPEIEKHIDKLTDILIGENDDLNDEYTVEDCENMELELDDKESALFAVSGDLSDMKKFVSKMRKSDLKTTLLSYIENMETNLC